MTKNDDLTSDNAQEVAEGEVFPPARPASFGSKAGSTEDLKALHADLTNAYREYLEMGKIKPSMLNPAMLSLIQTFLRHNEVKAEALKQSEMNALEKRLQQRRAARENDHQTQNIVSLKQSKQE